MRKLNGTAFVYTGVIVVASVFIIGALLMEELSNKLLPLLIAVPVLALAAVGLVREILASDRTEKTGEGAVETKALQPPVRGYLIVAGWIIGFFVAMYLFGLLIASFLFVLSYMRTHSIKWLTAAISAVLVPAAVWATFSFALDILLPQGLLLRMMGIILD